MRAFSAQAAVIWAVGDSSAVVCCLEMLARSKSVTEARYRSPVYTGSVPSLKFFGTMLEPHHKDNFRAGVS